jgi:hypothetical protein
MFVSYLGSICLLSPTSTHEDILFSVCTSVSLLVWQLYEVGIIMITCHITCLFFMDNLNGKRATFAQQSTSTMLPLANQRSLMSLVNHCAMVKSSHNIML